MEYKSFAFDLDTVAEDGRFSGYAATFGNVDRGGDLIVKGAFARSLARTRGGKVPILDHHHPDRQIGWNLEAREDAHGLLVQGQLDLNVQAARERHSLMKLARKVGAPSGLSIGFQTLDAERDARHPGIRRLTQVDLLEYSLVTFPMNTRAQVTAVKSEQDLETALRRLHRFLRAF